MTFKYEEYEAKIRARREARERKRKEEYNKRAETTAHNKKIVVGRTKTMMNQLVKMIRESGLSQTKISQMSGVCTATLTRIVRGRNHDSAPFSAVVGICRALGYKVIFEEIPLEQDEFINDRYVKGTRLLDKKVESEQ